MQITDMLNQYNRNIANGTEISGGTQGIRQIASSLQQLSVGNVFEGSITHMENGVVTLGLSDGKTIQARLDSGVSVRVGESMFFQVRSNSGTQIEIRPFSQAGGMNPALLNALKVANLPADGKMVTMVNSMMELSMPIDKQSLVQMAKLVVGNGRMDAATIVQMAKLKIPVTEEMAAQFENYKSDQYAILDSLEAVMETLPDALAHGSGDLKGLLELNRQMLEILLGEIPKEADGKVTVNGEGAGNTAQQPQDALQTEGQAGGKVVLEGGVLPEAELNGSGGLQPEEAITGKNGAQLAEGLAGKNVVQLAEGLVGENKAPEAGAAGKPGPQPEAGILGKETVQPGADTAGKAGIQPGEGQQLAEAAASDNRKAAVYSAQTDTVKSLFNSSGLQHLSGYLAKIPELSQNPAVFQNGMLAAGLSSRELLQLIGQAFSSKNPFSRQALSGLVSSKEYRTLIRNAMEQQWLLRPEALKGEHKVSELYERLDRQMEHMEKVLKSFGQSTPQLSDTAASVRNNIQFMNQLNQNFAYVQIPLKLAGQNAHSDLYVYTDKRKKRGKDDELTAFLHLDLDHLGPADVSIKLHNRQVSTNFYLADELSYQILSEHIEILEGRLLEKGYNAKIYISNQKEKVNFVEDILKQGAPAAGGMVHRYSFDVRA